MPSKYRFSTPDDEQRKEELEQKQAFEEQEREKFTRHQIAIQKWLSVEEFIAKEGTFIMDIMRDFLQARRIFDIKIVKHGFLGLKTKVEEEAYEIETYREKYGDFYSWSAWNIRLRLIATQAGNYRLLLIYPEYFTGYGETEDYPTLRIFVDGLITNLKQREWLTVANVAYSVKDSSSGKAYGVTEITLLPINQPQ